MMANQPDNVLVNKFQKAAVVLDVAIPSNISKKVHEKPEKYQELKEEVDMLWRVKISVVPVLIKDLCALTLGLFEKTSSTASHATDKQKKHLQNMQYASVPHH